jgi:NADPH-dependent ferric siderophore reductase
MESEPSDETVVQTAAEAAEEVIFERVDRDDLADYDVTVSFDAGRLDVDVYVHAPESPGSTEQLTEDAVFAARDAVDELLE